MVTCNIMFFGRLLPNEASRITQSQFRTKIKITFATWLHISIELQNRVLIYRVGRTATLNLPTGTKGSCFGIMAPYCYGTATLQKWNMNQISNCQVLRYRRYWDRTFNLL